MEEAQRGIFVPGEAWHSLQAIGAQSHTSMHIRPAPEFAAHLFHICHQIISNCHPISAVQHVFLRDLRATP